MLFLMLFFTETAFSSTMLVVLLLFVGFVLMTNLICLSMTDSSDEVL